MNTFLRVLFCVALGLAPAACGGGGAPAADPAPAPEAGPPPAGTPFGTATGHVLVKPTSLLALSGLLADFLSTPLGAVPGTSFHKVRVPTGQTPTGFVTALENDARVVAAALDLGLSAPEGGGLTIPAGGLLLSAELPGQDELIRIGIVAAQSRATGQGMRVAVLDSGIVHDHPFVAGRLEALGYDFVADDPDPSEERNGIDDDENGYVDEGWGHGTFAAGMVLSVAPGAQVLPVRVLGSDLFGTSSGVAAGITYAANQGVDVINLSVLLPAEVEVVREAIQNAQALGVVVIGAAGNTGAEDAAGAPGPGSPFLVTAVAADDVRASFASYGSAVALAAPGVDLHSAFPTTDPDTAIWSGTSFSAPIATGAFCLVCEAFPLLTSAEVLDRLRGSAVDIDALNPGFEGRLGAGRIDLDRATAP